MSRLNLTDKRVKLIGTETSLSKGIQLKAETTDGPVTLRFTNIHLNKHQHVGMYDGYVAIAFHYKDRDVSSDEDCIFIGVNGSRWPDVCLIPHLRNKFLEEILALYGRANNMIILSYKTKLFRDMTTQQMGRKTKVWNKLRGKQIFNHEPITRQDPKLHFVAHGELDSDWFIALTKFNIDSMMHCMLNNTNFVESPHV